jgi:alpha-tubulin suppressor-like RCC1 family protein
LQYAAAVISLAIGPSGPNDVYLLNLHTFLSNAAQHSSDAALALANHSGDYHTEQLAGMVNTLQTELRPYFLFGAGSNEHNQLLLNSIHKEEVHELNEVLLVVPRQQNSDDNTKSIYAGGGHSALLTNNGDLYLWGWNDSNQLGRGEEPVGETVDDSPLLNVIQPLSNIKVETADLGHNHTLVIEKNTGRLFGYGENGRGQVSGSVSDTTDNNSYRVPQTPIGLEDECFIDVAAGLFHSAAITNQGELITWGCGRFGQCLAPTNSEKTTVGRWQPNDGSKLVKVVCGRRHTVVLDEHGRIWTLGDNKYGQLGRLIDDSSSSKDREPQLVDGPLGQVNSGCFAVYSGWSHILALSRDMKDSDTYTLYGWGRNDKRQLGSMPASSSQSYISIPQVLNSSSTIQAACCGAESSHVVDLEGKIQSTGWNEHGNLGIGHYDQQNDDASESSNKWMATTGTRVVAPPSTNSKEEKKTKILLAAGGAHLIAMAVAS